MPEPVLFGRKRNRVDYAQVEADGSVLIKHTWFHDTLLRQVKQASEAQPAKHDGMRPEAFVPDDVLSRSFKEGWFHDDVAWRRWANDPANQAFRLQHGGRIRQL